MRWGFFFCRLPSFFHALVDLILQFRLTARSVTGKTFVIVSEALEHGCLRDRLVAARKTTA